MESGGSERLKAEFVLLEVWRQRLVAELVQRGEAAPGARARGRDCKAPGGRAAWRLKMTTLLGTRTSSEGRLSTAET